MDVSGSVNNVEREKRNDMSLDWQISRTSLADSSAGVLGTGNLEAETVSCSTVFMPDSYCPPMWDQPVNEHDLGYCDLSIQNQVSTSSSLGHAKTGVSWIQNATLGGGLFLPTVPGMLPPSLPHFPTDSAFIERAARFSCFGGGNVGEMVNPFSIPDPVNPYSRNLGKVSGVNGLKPISETPFQRHEMNMTEVLKEGVLPREHEKKSNSFRRSHDELKQGFDASGNDSDEAEFSGRDEDLDRTAEGSSGARIGSKKRKRAIQVTEHEEDVGAPLPSSETAKDHVEVKLKGDQNPTLVNKSGTKHGKQGSQGSDTPKEEYIHVRARRGQATNSHSLAERVRREKISERMKFLQDLVPGCNKVTGKAVMLDEIINYVQSLQRQVEFLSMKLATVNPRLDFNMEALLTKDHIPQPRAGLSSSSSSLAFPPDMAMHFPPLHPLQTGLIQANLPCLGLSAEALRRPINLQPNAGMQVPSIWEDGLHNIIHMGFETNAPPNSQDLSGPLPPGHLKAEH